MSNTTIGLTVHTLRYGNPPWLSRCAASLEDWCKRHDYPLKVWDGKNDYPAPKFCEIDMLRDFIASDYRKLIYVDADVLIHPNAPAFRSPQGLAMATDVWHAEHLPHFTEWARDNYRITVPADWEYSNAGVWSITREMAAKLLAAMERLPMVEFFQEQHWVNAAAISAIQEDGMLFNRLPDRWNQWGRVMEPAWFVHFWGNTKEEDMAAYDAAHLFSVPLDTAIRYVKPLKHPSSEKVVVQEFVQDAGLGNQLFEWASGYAIARDLNLPFRWVWKDSSKRDFGLTRFGIAESPPFPYKLVMSRVGQGSRKLRELAKKRILEAPETVCAISCPFQDEQCFSEYADDIEAQFQTEECELPNPVGTVPVGIQVRRGDYIGHPRLNVVTPEYFLNAMAWMRERIPNAHFIVVSDDPSWCRKFFGYLGDTTVMPPQAPHNGIATLASCHAHVISNSTFGWWGAWLGERRHGGPVVVPEIWYHGKGSYGEWEPVPERWHRVSIGKRQKTVEAQPLILDPDLPSHDRAIVYPWKADDERWHELRYSLRSVNTFFRDKDCPIYILGTRKPGWLVEGGRVRYLGAFTYREALSKGIQLAEKVLWMNDDIAFLKETGWEECEQTLYLREVGKEFLERAQTQANPWREGCLLMLKMLAGEGITTQRVYSTHTPYVYRRNEAVALLEKYGLWEKFPMELAYFHHHAVNPIQITTERATGVPFGDARFLNYSDNSLTAELRQRIVDLLPERAPWELPMSWGM